MKNAIDYALVADLYDTYVVTNIDIDFFLNETKKISGEVLELMSGTGRLSIPLIEAGVKLTCVDNSSEMLAIFKSKLKERKLLADVYEMDVRMLSLHKKFGLVIIPFHSFEELIFQSEQIAALKATYAHLDKNGLCICTLRNPPLRLKTVDGQSRLLGKYKLANSKDTLFLFSSETYDSDRHVVKGLQRYEIYDASGGLKSKRALEIQFCLYTKIEFAQLAEATGLKVKALYDDYAYAEFREDSSPFMIWVLEK